MEVKNINNWGQAHMDACIQSMRSSREETLTTEEKKCKYGLKWEHCPFDNRGCFACEGNDLIPLSARGYINQSKTEKDPAMRYFLLNEGKNHIVSKMYAIENAYRKVAEELANLKNTK